MPKKILYICPHLSTGGQPQYTFAQVDNFINEGYDVSVIEYNNLGGNDYVVQKKKIQSICNLFTLDEDKSHIIDLIKLTSPDFIHFQEIPQTFISEDILNWIFRDEREYLILTTTHSSLSNPRSIKYHPDKYVLVNEWSKDIFQKTEVPCDVWEYPIYSQEITDEIRQHYKEKLSFDKNKKHILNVGLFTEGKNQKQIIEIANKMLDYDIVFHFVGNTAPNFSNYWKPLVDNLPKNCIVWGEKSNVDEFYSASDLFLFTSNFELNPIAVKESLSLKLPTFIKKLKTYKDYYDNNELVTYIGDDNEDIVNKILNKLDIK